MIDNQLEQLNESLWKEWILKATEVNCCKICGAVVDNDTARDLKLYVQGFEINDTSKSLIRNIASGKYTPPGLDCTLRGEKQPNHLMLKIEPLEHPSGNALYEFLIEYDRMDPNVGIYLGFKCLTDAKADHREMIKFYVEEWENLRNHVCTVLNNSFPGKDFRYRFRVTNNGENHTFWPMWISLYDDEDMDFALTVLRILRRTYQQFFSGTLKKCRPLPPVEYRHIPASFTESTYISLRETISGIYGKSYESEAGNLFDRFILTASGAGIFHLDPSYDLAWRYTGEPSLNLTGSNIEFSTIMHILPREIGRQLGLGDGNVKTAWGEILKVFIDAEGVAFKPGTRSQWQNALDDTVAICTRVVRQCLSSDTRD